MASSADDPNPAVMSINCVVAFLFEMNDWWREDKTNEITSCCFSGRAFLVVLWLVQGDQEETKFCRFDHGGTRASSSCDHDFSTLSRSASALFSGDVNLSALFGAPLPCHSRVAHWPKKRQSTLTGTGIVCMGGIWTNRFIVKAEQTDPL